MLKIGIIGCGKIAQVRHIPEFAANLHTELAAYYDPNQARAAELAEQYGGSACASYQELLARPDIDAVSVCAPNASHAPITIAALQAGKHVLCEKPMAATLEECEAMVQAARQSGRTLMLGHNQRLARAHVKAKELIAQGLIGEILSFRTTFGHPGPETWSIDPGKNLWFFDRSRAAMGVMGDLGIHKTDLIHFLTGQVVVETTARFATLDKRDENGEPIAVEDNAFCIYRLSGGAVGTLTASWTFYGVEDNSTVLYGTRGEMRLYDDPTYAIQVTTREGEQILYNIDRIQTNESQTHSGVIDAFVSCLVENRPPEISGEEALKTMRVVFASLESARRGGLTVCINHPELA